MTEPDDDGQLESDEETAVDDGSARVAQESTLDLAKLIVSLASAVVTLSATFADKFSQDVRWTILILFVAWGLLAASVVFGVTAISSLVYAQWTLADRWGDTTFPPMKCSWRLFQSGMVALLVYAGVASGIRAFHHEPTREAQCYIVSAAVAPESGSKTIRSKPSAAKTSPPATAPLKNGAP